MYRFAKPNSPRRFGDITNRVMGPEVRDGMHSPRS